VNGQADSVLRFFCLPWLEHYISSADITLHTESDAILAGLDLHGLTKLFQITANLQEFG